MAGRRGRPVAAGHPTAARLELQPLLGRLRGPTLTFAAFVLTLALLATVPPPASFAPPKPFEGTSFLSSSLPVRLGTWLPVAAWLWAAAVGAMILRLLGGWWLLRRYRRAAAAAGAALQARLDRLASHLGLRFSVPLRISDALTVPTRAGAAAARAGAAHERAERAAARPARRDPGARTGPHPSPRPTLQRPLGGHGDRAVPPPRRLLVRSRDPSGPRTLL